MKLIAFIFALFLPIASFAQTKKVSYVNEGEKAPFAGILLSPEAFAEMKFKSEQDEEMFRLKLNLQTEKALLLAKLNLDNQVTETQLYNKMCDERLVAKDKTIKFYEDTVKKQSNIWEDVDLHVGITIGILSTIGTFVLVDYIDDNYIED